MATVLRPVGPDLRLSLCQHTRTRPASCSSTSWPVVARPVQRHVAEAAWPAAKWRKVQRRSFRENNQLGTRSYTTHGSFSSTLKGDEKGELPNCLSASDKRAYEQLRPILDDLPGPIDWAVAYGSGVRHQANAQPDAKAPMTDYLLSVPDTTSFHAANMRRNPAHYPMTSRILGAAATGWLTENWGAGVWYVTMVRIRDLFISQLKLIRQEVKYGIISTGRLKRDLERWETLYVSGRLHKPVLPLIQHPTLTASLQANHRSALTVALLLLPPTFSELDLWTRIAGLSYAGDPRMSVPGAENPDKVKNIVSGQGAREGMRAIYGPMLAGLDVRYDDATEQEEEWLWKVDGTLSRPNDQQYLARLLSGLPANLKDAVARAYGRSTRVEAHASPSSSATMADGEPTSGAIWLDIVSGRAAPQGGPPASVAKSPDSTPRPEASEKARETVQGSLAAEVELVWRAVLLRELQNTIRRPALTQSLKGLFTAGMRKSFSYAAAKFGKWLAARRVR